MYNVPEGSVLRDQAAYGQNGGGGVFGKAPPVLVINHHSFSAAEYIDEFVKRNALALQNLRIQGIWMVNGGVPSCNQIELSVFHIYAFKFYPFLGKNSKCIRIFVACPSLDQGAAVRHIFERIAAVVIVDDLDYIGS